MKTITRFLLLVTFFVAAARAADTDRNAKLLAVTGSVAVSVPEGKSVTAEPGLALPVGSSIVTAVGAQATVQFFDGTVVVVESGTSVTIQVLAVKPDAASEHKEETMLDLHSGGIVASLDPAKKKITDFQVRTPKGVAAARGTVFAVRVVQNTSDASVTTMSGYVTFITDHGEITIPFGQVSTGGAAVSVAAAVKAYPNLAKEILEATSDVAAAVGAGDVKNTEGTPNLVATVLAAIVDVAVQAAPDSAVDIVKDVIKAAGPALQGSDGAALTKIIADSAVQSLEKSSPTGSTSASDIRDAAAKAAEDAGVKTETGSENPILPPLDTTQVKVSPSGARSE